MQPGIRRPAQRGQASYNAGRAQPQRTAQQRPTQRRAAPARNVSTRRSPAAQGAQGRAPQPRRTPAPAPKQGAHRPQAGGAAKGAKIRACASSASCCLSP